MYSDNNSITAALSLMIYYPSWLAILFLNFSIPPPPTKTLNLSTMLIP